MLSSLELKVCWMWEKWITAFPQSLLPTCCIPAEGQFSVQEEMAVFLASVGMALRNRLLLGKWKGREVQES